MQLAGVGRNEPCPCGSGQKYKKCCLSAREALIAGSVSTLDVAALVDRAIADDDWDAVEEVFDQGFLLFEPMGPLEHVRFRHDLITARAPDAAELSRMCTAGWQRHCEEAIAYVLARHALDPEERDGLRLASYLLRRFGAQSALVEAIAELQVAEHGVRVQKFGDTLSRFGYTLNDIAGDWIESLDWIQREQPSTLLFADWFALRSTPAADADDLWLSSVAPRVCDLALAALERPDLREARRWAQIAAIALLHGIPQLGIVLPRISRPRLHDAEEQRVYEAITTRQLDDRLEGSIGRIARATEARGDYAGAAMLRASIHRVQSWHW